MTGDDRLWWEDFTPGREWRFGHYDVTTEEIIDFARRYDPLDMHTDPALAARTPLGVFCASGLHTFGMAQRMMVDNLMRHSAIHAGGMIDAFRMLKPVLPGDRLHMRIAVVDTRPHPRRADRGWITLHMEVMRGEDEIVLDYHTQILMVRRPDLAHGPQA